MGRWCRLITPSLLGFAAKLRPVKDDIGVSLDDRCLVRSIGNMLVVSAALPKPGWQFTDIIIKFILRYILRYVKSIL